VRKVKGMLSINSKKATLVVPVNRHAMRAYDGVEVTSHHS
jgi:hypothetical protein